MSVSCPKYLAQEHNKVSPARARARTAQSGDEHTNHEATAPPIGLSSGRQLSGVLLTGARLFENVLCYERA